MVKVTHSVPLNFWDGITCTLTQPPRSPRNLRTNYTHFAGTCFADVKKNKQVTVKIWVWIRDQKGRELY
jgi:hypothetical protein